MPDLECPGRSANAGKEPTLTACPACGRTVEIFGDEMSVTCRCGRLVGRRTPPACAQWCAGADRCLGTAGASASLPGPQQNYRLAFEQALERLAGRKPEHLAALGARPAGPGRWELEVLDAAFLVDLAAGRVALADAEREPLMAWRILALHYLLAQPPWKERTRWVSFADLPEARGYEPVYRGRVLGRLTAGAGRDRDSFAAACRRLGGEKAEWGDEGFTFRVFPRLPVAVAWYQGDEEIPTGLSFVYPDNIGAFLPAEDVVVLSERLVGRLQGGEW